MWRTGDTTIIWDILDRFPNVTEFTFGAIILDDSAQAAMVSPHHHSHLSTINLLWSIYYPTVTTYFLIAISQAASDNLFPSLHEVRVWEFRGQIDQAQVALFTRMGLTLEFTERYQSGFVKSCHLLHAPFIVLI
jgi:hypothetical protein